MDSDSWSESDNEDINVSDDEYSEENMRDGDGEFLSADQLEKITAFNFEETDNEIFEELINSQEPVEISLPKRVKIFFNHIDKHLTKHQIIRPAFQDITPAFVDGVPFFVDGDSLMLTMLYDENWSPQLGGSSLHLVYLFERYLNIFVQRNGIFHLIFFQSWRSIWHSNWTILLYRSILINHFSKNVENYPVHIFDDCLDKKFLSLISAYRPGFILTNMEAHEQCAEVLKKENNIVKHIMNINLLVWLKNDLPCIDTNHIKLDVSLVRGFYLECNPDVRGIINQHLKTFTKFMNDLPKIEEFTQFPKSIELSNYNIRVACFLTAGFLFYKKSNDENMLKMFFLTSAMMEFLNLKNRCCPKFIVPLEELDKIIGDWHKYMYFALSAFQNKNFDYSVVSDLWQGILFGHVCRFASSSIDNSENLGPDVAVIYEKMIQDFNMFGYSIKAYPIKLSCSDLNFETITSLTANETDLKPLIPINNPLVLTFCGDILHDIKWHSPPEKMVSIKYTEEHHYHSMKVITDEHDYVKTDIHYEGRQHKFLRERNANARYMTLYGSSILGRPLETSGVIRNSKNNKQKVKQSNSKKKQEILDAKMKKDALEQEKKDKKLFDDLKDKYKKFDVDYEKLLGNVDLVLKNKTFCEGSFKTETMLLKLKIMREILKLNNSRKLDIEKSIFLTIQDILVSKIELDSKNKALLSKCLSAIKCTEIAKRNGLPVQDYSPDDDKWIRFQLEELGPELTRETGGKPDPRVRNFIPDPWQSKLFDIVDSKQSALIVAPTSSGKTYASYYCMESVLREGTEGIVVYCAPTKALVNQVAATVYANFKDTKMPDGMSVYGTFTRDHRTYALSCQILITVPQCLEILLMSPRRHSWVKRLRYVIFDEIHCIEGDIGAASFERCLLLIRCPFLALSATIRNPDVLKTWLQRAEDFKHERDIQDGCARDKNSYKLHLVIHSERHSDLTKYTFGNGQLHHLHPYAELEANVIKQNHGIPPHMTLSPAETLQLYDTMHSVFPKCKELEILSPIKYFSTSPDNGFISRNLVRKYASDLSNLLEDWFKNHRQKFQDTIRILKPVEQDGIVGTGNVYILENVTTLISHLKENNMLPALIFAYNRKLIKRMTEVTTEYFEKNKSKRLSNPSSCKQKENVPGFKVVEDRLDSKKYKSKALSTFSGNAQENLSKMISRRDYVDRKNNPWRKIYVDQPLYLISEDAEYSLQGIGVIDSEDIQFIEKRLRRAKINTEHLIVRSMRNGMCLHHAGLNNKIRSSVEMLFRKKFLNAVFATGTLALGIHMPCKTVVVAGNSAYLNSLEYHQMSGRAGRRGYDTAGNVIFFGINPHKQHSLMTAKLPYIKGNFPVTVSLILRALLLVSDVTEKGKKSEEATKISISRILTMLEHSLCYMQNESLKINIKHFFSFTLQLLKIQGFINENGEPLSWCGVATHLHYHEPGNLAFVYLLKTGIFRKICSESKNKEDIYFTLLTILSYLFTKVPLDCASKKPFNNSVVTLDPLPEIVYQALEDYNNEVRFVFEQYFLNVANYFNESDNTLPLSSINIVGKNSISNITEENMQNKFLNMCVPKLICSSFSALSGNNDDNAYTEKALITNLKERMTTDVKIIPLISVDVELNGYAVDFYRHGIVKSIREDNGLREGEEFQLLKDFKLVLNTIRVSLEEMGLKDENDIVYIHFKKLQQDYDDKYDVAFGREHM